MRLKHYENKARQSYWRIHIDAWRNSGQTRTAYCLVHRLCKTTFDRWIRIMAGHDAARKHMEYQAQIRLEEKQKKLKARNSKRRFSVSTDIRIRGLQASVQYGILKDRRIQRSACRLA